MKSINKKISLLAVLLVLVSGCSMKKEKIVGKDIKVEAITAFYYTDSATTNPPRFQRYYFHVEDGKYFFTHEKREGESVFLTEKDITVTGTLELSEEEWNVFFDYLKDGRVSKRGEGSVNSGSSVDLYVYWNGDKEVYQVFSFEPSSKRKGFEDWCLELKNREMAE